MPDLSRRIVTGEELHQKIYKGIQEIYDMAAAAYGPKAGNALIEMPYGSPLISRDGVTNVEKVNPKDPIARATVDIIRQASRKNNKRVGDGTTAAVILSYHLYMAARKLIGAGYNRMEVSKMLQDASLKAIDAIDAMKKPVTKKLLEHVAIVSAGDGALGQMIADVVQEAGVDGGIMVEDFAGAGVYNELVEGFYFRKGFTNQNLLTDVSNLRSEHKDVDIFITDKSLRTTADIAPILEKVIVAGGKGSEMVIIGEVLEEALAILILNRQNVTTTVVDVPVQGAMRTLFLEDIACITGGKVFPAGASSSSFDVDMLGSADAVYVDEHSTTIVGVNGIREDVDTRIAELRKQLDEAESPATIEALKSRLEKLTGKIAKIMVGGASEVEQQEVKLRAEDAINAVQAAIKDGIVVGGGVALARVAPETFKEAYQAPFKQLVTNAGLNAEKALWTVLDAPTWHGYNLRRPTEKPVDLLKEGIVDPSLVIKEVIKNATSVVSQLITVDIGSVFNDRTQKYD
jgi:chaperonin GroEL